MKKSELNLHAVKLEKAYKEANKTWAALGLLYAAIDKEQEKAPPVWMQLEILRGCIEKTADIGLNLAEFLDCHEENKGGKA